MKTIRGTLARLWMCNGAALQCLYCRTASHLPPDCTDREVILLAPTCAGLCAGFLYVILLTPPLLTSDYYPTKIENGAISFSAHSLHRNGFAERLSMSPSVRHLKALCTLPALPRLKWIHPFSSFRATLKSPVPFAFPGNWVCLLDGIKLQFYRANWGKTFWAVPTEPCWTVANALPVCLLFRFARLFDCTQVLGKVVSINLRTGN